MPVDAFEVAKRHHVERLGGWELKPYAVMHSRFREVLLLDADNVPVRDPSFLFDRPEYRDTGALFWPDIVRLSPDNEIWAISGLSYRDTPSVEFGADGPRQIPVLAGAVPGALDQSALRRVLPVSAWRQGHIPDRLADVGAALSPDPASTETIGSDPVPARSGRCRAVSAPQSAPNGFSTAIIRGSTAFVWKGSAGRF